MMLDLDFDRLLESTLASRGPQVAPASVGDDVMRAIRSSGQRRPRVRVLDPRAWPAPRRSVAHPATIRAARIVLVTILVTALLATGAFVGARLLESGRDPELVFGSVGGGLFIAGLDGTGARRIADGRYIEPRLSSDGRWIAADLVLNPGASWVPGPTNGRRLVVLRTDGTRVMDLPSMNPAWAYAWGAAGPSAAWLAVALDESVIVVDPTTGSRVTIDTAGANVHALAWSPDAPVLWWAAGHPGIFGRGIEGADIHAIRFDATGGTLRIADERSFVLDLDPQRMVRGLEAMAVSPDGRTLAFRARTEGWLRSDVVLVDAAGGDASFINPAPPGEPWIAAWSGIRWAPGGTGVVVEVGETTGTDAAIIRPSILPIDGSPPRPIEAGPFSVDGFGVVASDGPVRPTDTGILVGGARSYLDLAGGQVSTYDLWLADANGAGSRLVATGTFGGDLR